MNLSTTNFNLFTNDLNMLPFSNAITNIHDLVDASCLDMDLNPKNIKEKKNSV